MNPLLMLALTTALQAGSAALGSKGEHGSTYTKRQKGGINDIFDIINNIKGGSADISQNPQYQQGQDWLSGLFNDQDFFKNFEAPLQRQFNEETIPSLAHRYGAMGSGGSTGSTAFRNQLAREGSNLSTNIAAIRGGLQSQGVNQSLQYAQQPFQNLMSLYSQALGIAPNNTYQGPSTGPLGNTLSAFNSSLASGYGQKLGQNMATG
jgi:hypothetical protein